MIQEKTYTRDWVMGKSIEYMRGRRKADPTLIEKVTKAFHLLEELAKTNLKFVFKGGTSLLLLLSQLHRFSIDIDIIVDEHEDEENLNAFLTEVIRNNPVFNRYEIKQEHLEVKSRKPIISSITFRYLTTKRVRFFWM